MREIKFRAWAKTAKRMILNVHELYDGSIGEIEYPFRHRSFGEVLEEPDFIVMQFTGLHDKNGKEIYEGDVLYHEREGKDHDWKKPGWKRVVEWNSEIAGFDLDADIDIQAEIIGNIYENPDLLSTASSTD